jgi:hypothetical protein
VERASALPASLPFGGTGVAFRVEFGVWPAPHSAVDLVVFSKKVAQSVQGGIGLCRFWMAALAESG